MGVEKKNGGSGNEPITVAHVVLSLEIGGMETVISHIARNMDQDSFRVIVICLNEIGQIGQELIEEGIMVIDLPRMKKIISFIYPKELIDILKKENVDIVHSHSGVWHKAAVAGRLARCKGIIYTEHGRLVPDPRSIIYLDRVISVFTDYIVSVSNDLFDYMKDMIKIDSRKMVNIPNGIDTSFFRPETKNTDLMRELGLSGDEFVLGCIARLAPVKDHLTLVRAFKIAAESYMSLKLLIVGGGPEEAKIRDLVKELDLEEKILLLGQRRDIRKILSVIDLFVLSSVSEGTSMTVLEAMSSEKPVLATEVGGNPGVITHGKNGFLVPSGRPELFAKRLCEVMDNPDKMSGMGLHARETVNRFFSLESMTKAYETLYFDLTESTN